MTVVTGGMWFCELFFPLLSSSSISHLMVRLIRAKKQACCGFVRMGARRSGSIFREDMLTRWFCGEVRRKKNLASGHHSM